MTLSYFKSNARRALFFIALFLANIARAGLAPLDTETFFVPPETTSTLRWQNDGAATETVPFTITNYRGALVLKGKALMNNGAVEANVNLPQGYYEIAFDAGKTEEVFGIVSIPAFDRSHLDPYFCIDSALSWLERSEAQRTSLIRMLHRSGIALSRERFSWKQISPERGQWFWEGVPGIYYNRLRKTYEQEGLPILECFHDSPKWMENPGSYPVEQISAQNDLLTIAQRWSGSWGALEIWNETDAAPFSVNRAMDQYAPFVHATAYNFDANGIKIPLVGGAFSGFQKVVIDNALRNGLLDSIDALSYHTYAKPREFEARARDYRMILESTNRPSIPLWITESGSPWTSGTGRPGKDEDMVSALNITAKVSEGRASGIARVFPFVAPSYRERNKNFGMVGEEGTPLRSLGGYAYAITALSNLSYLGDIKFEKNSSVELARVFGSDTEKEVVVVISTDQPCSGASIAFDLPVTGVRGIDGRLLKRSDPKSIPIEDGLTYIRLDRDALAHSGRLSTDTTAMRLYNLARQPDSGRSPSSPVVLQFIPDSRRMMLGSELCLISYGQIESMPLCVRAVNLDPKNAHTVAVNLAAGPLGKASTPLGRSKTITLPPRSEQNLDWTVDLHNIFRESEKVTVLASARCESDAIASKVRPLSIDFLAERDLSELLGFYGKRVVLAIQDVTKWNPAYINKKVGGRLNITSENSKKVTINIAFDKDGDEAQYWAYPHFPIPEGTDLRGAEGMIVRARVTHPSSVRAFVWKEGGVGYFTPSPILPSDGEWHTAFIPFNGLHREWSSNPDKDPNLIDYLQRVHEIAIGANTQQRINTLEVSDAIIVWKK
ncbi:MAG: hypothetical protein PW999_29375 [Paraburkholderia tropica]|nr:hypothetical protein [Paraburkholderia tropica]